eukprot:274409_1
MSSQQPLLRTPGIRCYRKNINNGETCTHVKNITDLITEPIEWQSISIDKILCKDIILHILSFSGFCHTKGINTLWNQLSQKAEQIHVTKQVHASQNKYSFNNINNYDRKINTTYIITPNRKSLYKWEEILEWKIWNGSIDNIKIDSKNEICSGDRFVIYDGIYSVNQLGIQINESVFDEYNNNNKYELYFIGVGQKVLIEICEYKGDNINDEINRTFISTGTNCNIYIFNLTIDCAEMDYLISSHIVVKPFSILTMNNCKLFMGGNGIDMWWNCKLKLDSCQFIGGCVAVDITVSGIVNITNCLFQNNGNDKEFESSSQMSSIQIRHTIQDHLGSKLRLNCKGNKFINNLCYPIAEKYIDNEGKEITDKYCEMSNLYVLEDNILTGFNATA